MAGPERIRNGELFEMVVRVEPDREVEELVILVGADIWRDVTVNSFVPAAAEEGYRDGTFAFSFGAVEAGAPFVMKVDGQVNPDHSLMLMLHDFVTVNCSVSLSVSTDGGDDLHEQDRTAAGVVGDQGARR